MLGQRRSVCWRFTNVVLTLYSQRYLILIFTHLKLRLAGATRNFKRVKINHICLIWHQENCKFAMLKLTFCSQ